METVRRVIINNQNPPVWSVSATPPVEMETAGEGNRGYLGQQEEDLKQTE